MVRARIFILLLLLLVSSVALLFWRSTHEVQAQGPAPICDVSCAPDPGGSGYGGTFAARSEPPNARGLSSSIVPKQISLPGGHEPDPHPGRGPKPAILLGSESYNYAVSILSLPGRNGLDLNLTAYYSSRTWTIDSTNNTVTFNADRDFPSYGFRLGFGYLEYDVTSDTFVLTEADGTKRSMSYDFSSGYDSNDSSYIKYTPSTKVLRYKNGTQVLYESFPDPAFSATLSRPKKITDTNGNFITITYLTGTGRNQHISTITDTLGRVITFNYDGDGRLTSITQGAKTHATFAWNTAYILKYNFTSLVVTNSPANNSTHNVLTGLTYPGNGTSYNFIYGDWGIVKKTEHKSSSGDVRSYFSYNYPASTTPLAEHPSWTTETVFDGVNTLTTNYSVTKSGGVVNTSTVTGPGGTKSVTTLDASGQVSSVEIKDAANLTLRRSDYVWTAAPNSKLTSVTNTLSDTGQQSKVALTYTTYGNVSEVKEYDYGLVLTRITSMTYLTTSAYVASNRHILDRPTQVLVKDGGADIKARTDFVYDGTGLTNVTGATNHDDANYPYTFLTRGNVTQVKRYSAAAAGSGLFTRNFYYDSLGNLRTADLDCCTTKQWTYNSTTQYAYPITITTGPVGTQLTTSATYNFASGTVASSTDQNSKTTNYAYDNMDRLSTVTLPNGVVLTTTYNDSAVLPSVTGSSTANSAVQETVVDAKGRPLQNQLRNGATAVSTITTSYNDVARQVSTTNPTGPSESAVWTLTQFDYLGRPIATTPPGSGGSYQYAYSGNAVTITDPAGKQRRNTTDALGRLVKVEEPGWGDGVPGTGSVTIARVAGVNPASITVTVNGSSKTTQFAHANTSILANNLASQINADSSFPVSAGVTGDFNTAVLNLTAKQATASTNYPLSASSSAPTYITATPSGPTLTGAQDPTGPDSASLNDPMTTTYAYDPMDNLRTVSQAAMGPVGGVMLGGQNRTYNYDSMSRLTSTVTPESATTSFYYTLAGGGTCSYDPSNVCLRVDARSITTTYGYDGLGRFATVSYSDGTPTVTYTYGTSAASNNKGRLITLADGAGSENYTYDLMGRITNVSKTITGATGNPYNLVYGYNNANQLTSLTYPSGRVVTQAYDAIGRTTSIASGAITYLSGLSFNAAGQALAFNYGNGVAATFSYNQRLQLASLRYVNGSTDLLNLAYNYGTQNNGQIKDIKYYTSPGVEDQTKSQNYQYDAWSRLKKAYTTNLSSQNTWRLEWDYDRFGNRKNQNLTGGNTSITTPQLSISETTNRITTAGYVYDAAGNMTNDSLHVYTYDAENLIKNTDNGTSNQNVYTYSGPMRVKKATGNPATTTTVYIFSGTKVIAEYVNGSLTKEYIYSGSALLATHDGATLRYHHRDHLGTRVDSDTAGNWTRKFGHFPFGESWYEDVQGGGVASKLKFTSYERDSESGLDQAMFRYNSPRLGRFMSPDPLAGRIRNPQSLNRFAYVTNDPANLIDPLGLCEVVCTTENGVTTCTCTVEEDDGDSGGGGGGGGGTFPDHLGPDPMLDFLAFLYESGFYSFFGEEVAPIGMEEARNKRLDPDRSKSLSDCIDQIYDLDVRTFVPSAPGQNGYFFALDSKGTMISVENSVAFSSTVLTVASLSFERTAGLTARDYPELNFTASDLPRAAYLFVQVHELAHSLDYLTSGKTSEESAKRLTDCVLNQ